MIASALSVSSKFMFMSTRRHSVKPISYTAFLVKLLSHRPVTYMTLYETTLVLYGDQPTGTGHQVDLYNPISIEKMEYLLCVINSS